MNNEIETHLHTTVFEGKNIRKIQHKNEWWFVVDDLVEALTDTSNSTDYIKKLKTLDPSLSDIWKQLVIILPIDTLDEKQNISCVNTEGIFRIIQSIHTHKAEPFKRWLARSGADRIQEIEDIELALNDIKKTYKTKISNDVYSNDLKVIFNMLGETSTAKKAFKRSSQGFHKYTVDFSNEKTTKKTRNDSSKLIDPSSFISHKLVIDKDDI